MKRYTLPLLLSLLALYATACRPSEPTKAAAPPPKLAPFVPEEALGSLFEDIQLAELFSDSKTFVDSRPVRDPAEIVADYQQLKNEGEVLKLDQFVELNFLPPRSFNSGFESDSNRNVAEHIEALWPVLTREPDSVGYSSLIPLPNPYIVPGGRFREIYYWDSYFTMLGLQVSNDAAKAMIGNMVANFAYLIDTVGFIPNGNRTYFRSRSQPPFFSLMVRIWEEESPGALAQYVPQLEAEYQFWMEGTENLSADSPAHRRVVRMSDGTILNRYWDDAATPRPESYREDVELAEEVDRPAEELYRDLRAACESGWDFSSRWLRDPMDLGTIRTTELIPVDLNSLLFHLEETLAEAYKQGGNPEKQAYYTQQASNRATAINQYCWSDGYYADYDWKLGKVYTQKTLAMAYPLYFNVATKSYAEQTIETLVNDFDKGIEGGLPTTLINSGQQWDAPNGWAPLQWITTEGMRNYGGGEYADSLQAEWIRLNEKVYQRTGRMVEKYNVMDLSLEAGGGEYTLQDGFGWSNGVMLRMLKQQ